MNSGASVSATRAHHRERSGSGYTARLVSIVKMSMDALKLHRVWRHSNSIVSGGTQTPSCLEALKLHHRVWRHHRHAAVGWRLHSPAACQSHRKLAAPHSGRARYRSCWCRTLAAPHSGRARHRPATGDGRRLTAPRSGRVRYHPRWRQTDARGTA